jgi:hypothetical protein
MSIFPNLWSGSKSKKNSGINKLLKPIFARGQLDCENQRRLFFLGSTVKSIAKKIQKKYWTFWSKYIKTHIFLITELLILEISNNYAKVGQTASAHKRGEAFENICGAGQRQKNMHKEL